MVGKTITRVIYGAPEFESGALSRLGGQYKRVNSGADGSKKLIVFIDGNNFESAVNSLMGGQYRIDLNRFSEYIALKRNAELIKFYFYTGIGNRPSDADKNKKTKDFIATLNSRFPKCVAKTGHLQFLGTDANGKDIFTEKATDVQLAVDLLTEAYDNRHVNEVVIVSADTDYEPVIRKAQLLGKTVVACVIDQQKAGYMKQICDDKIILQSAELAILKR